MSLMGFGKQPGPAGRDIAVIDIGSNSVRLVQYRLEDGALWPVFNEKTMAGLGKGAGARGTLNPDGRKSALVTLRRFASLLDAKGVTDRHAVATAAVRECSDGPEFVALAEAETGLKIEVLSGEEEGRLSALGVVAGIGAGHGVVGDLGGSSLEIARLTGREVGPVFSLPLGPLSVLNGGSDDTKRIRGDIDDGLDAAADALDGSGPDFYAVGGAWRSFAHLAMALDRYPLTLLHQYALTPQQISRAADFAMAQSEASLSATPGVSSKRASTLPYAAQLLKRIVKRGKFRRVVFSAHGLREGVAFSRSDALKERHDPLLAGADAMARHAASDPAFGAALGEWLEPVFAGRTPVFDAERDFVLRAAAARLSQLGARMHPDHRAELAATEALYAPFGGISHPERAFLALAVHHRYAGRRPRPEECPSRRLLDDAQEEAALHLGYAIRLGTALSGGSAGVLKFFTLGRDEDALILGIEPGREDLVVERARSRFESLAGILKLKPVLDRS
ncbi:MAG: Ppx/GppA phosphatase family protein [Caulobacterales bacterium]|uniref:Ppx/GppA phosphatase family protein n=1 Tax=Glycocaulis sp. TaxID=1969725 RepID=UPI003FA09FC2